MLHCQVRPLRHPITFAFSEGLAKHQLVTQSADYMQNGIAIALLKEPC